MASNDTSTQVKDRPEAEPLHFQFEIAPERTERVQKLYEHISNQKAGVCIERARYFTESFKTTEAYPQIIRRAKAFANTLEKMTLYVLPGSLLVGGHASKPNYSPLAPDFSTNFIKKEIIGGDPYFLPERPADKFTVDKSFIPELEKIVEYWEGRNQPAHMCTPIFQKKCLLPRTK